MFNQIQLSKIKIFLLVNCIFNSFLFASDSQIENIFKINEPRSGEINSIVRSAMK